MGGRESQREWDPGMSKTREQEHWDVAKEELENPLSSLVALGSPTRQDWAQEVSFLGYPSPSTHPSSHSKSPEGRFHFFSPLQRNLCQ